MGDRTVTIEFELAPSQLKYYKDAATAADSVELALRDICFEDEEQAEEAEIWLGDNIASIQVKQA